jgi:hypothetical protein
MENIFDLQKTEQGFAFSIVIERIEKIMNDNTLASDAEKDSLNVIYEEAHKAMVGGGYRKKSIKKKRKKKNKSRKNNRMKKK